MSVILLWVSLDNNEEVKPYNILEVKFGWPTLVAKEPLSTSITTSCIFIGSVEEPVTSKNNGLLLPIGTVKFSVGWLVSKFLNGL